MFALISVGFSQVQATQILFHQQQLQKNKKKKEKEKRKEKLKRIKIIISYQGSLA